MHTFEKYCLMGLISTFLNTPLSMFKWEVYPIETEAMSTFFTWYPWFGTTLEHVECALKFSPVTLLRMLSVQNVLLVLLVFVIPVFPIMPFQSNVHFPDIVNMVQNEMISWTANMAVALKFSKSEYRIRGDRRNFCTGCTTFLTRSTLKVSLNAL